MEQFNKDQEWIVKFNFLNVIYVFNNQLTHQYVEKGIYFVKYVQSKIYMIKKTNNKNKKKRMKEFKNFKIKKNKMIN